MINRSPSPEWLSWGGFIRLEKMVGVGGVCLSLDDLRISPFSKSPKKL